MSNRTEAFHNEITARPSSASTSPGQTIKVIDAWGRERPARYNAQGKLAEVVEPNPTGNGTVAATGNMATSYQYDAAGNQIHVKGEDGSSKDELFG